MRRNHYAVVTITTVHEEKPHPSESCYETSSESVELRISVEHLSGRGGNLCMYNYGLSTHQQYIRFFKIYLYIFINLFD